MVIGRTSPRLFVSCLLLAGLIILSCPRGAAAEVAFSGEGQFGADQGMEPPNYSQVPGARYAPFMPDQPGTQHPDLAVPPTPPYWLNSSFLLWYMKKQPLNVPVVTNGSSSLLGNQAFSDSSFNGLRLDLGAWLNEATTFGVELSFLAVFEGSPRNNVSAQTTLLERPYFDVATGLSKTLPIAVPGSTAGSITAGANGLLIGGEFNFLSRIYRNHEYESIDLILGFRNLDLLENIGIGSTTSIITGNGSFAGQTFLAPGTLNVSDAIKASNCFNGAQIGARAQTGGAGVTFSGYGKLAFGVMNEDITRTGYSVAAGPTLVPPLQSTTGGFFVTRTNSGSQSHNFFAVIPEIGMNLGLEVTSCMSLGIGYSILYVSNVARPGDQISPFINSHTIPTSPTFQAPPAGEASTRVFQTSDYWAQGLNFSVNFKF